MSLVSGYNSKDFDYPNVAGYKVLACIGLDMTANQDIALFGYRTIPNQSLANFRLYNHTSAINDIPVTIYWLMIRDI